MVGRRSLCNADHGRMVLTIDIQSQLRRLLHGECTLASLAQPVESESDRKPEPEPTFKSAGFKSSFKRIDTSVAANTTLATGTSAIGSSEEKRGRDGNAESVDNVDGEPVDDLDGEPINGLDGALAVNHNVGDGVSIEEDMDMDGEPMEDVDGDPIDEDVDGEPL